MEDGTRTVQSQGVKKTFFVSSHHQNFPIQSQSTLTSDNSDDHKVCETRLENGDEGILIDTGASINCVGGNFCERYNDLMQSKGAPPSERVKFERLPNPHFISGLGQGATRTTMAASIPCHARGLGGGQTYFKGAYFGRTALSSHSGHG